MSGKKEKREGEFECEHCSKSFAELRYLRKHIDRMHDNAKKRERVGKLSCGVCGKHFPRLSHLTRHQVVHFNVRDWSCPFCSLSFMQKAHLITHMGRKHRNERVADIEEEMEKVRGRVDEIVHGPAADPSLPSTSHSSPRLITDQLHIPIVICALCGANFFTNNELKRHKETNHVVRRCLRCGMNVNGRDAMREHLRKKHNTLSSPSSSSITCIHCSLQFPQRTQFDRHFLSRHFTISRCEFCREELRTPIERRDHMRDEHEEIRCGYCNELMNNEDALVKHVYATHWNRTERIKTKKKKSRKIKQVTIEEKEEEEEKVEIREVEKEKEGEKEIEMANEEEEEERQINISILLKLPLKDNEESEGDEDWRTIPLGKNLPSDITNLYPQLKTLHVVLPSVLSSSHSLLIALPLPYDESLNEWIERTIEIDLRNTVSDDVPIDN